MSYIMYNILYMYMWEGRHRIHTFVGRYAQNTHTIVGRYAQNTHYCGKVCTAYTLLWEGRHRIISSYSNAILQARFGGNLGFQ